MSGAKCLLPNLQRALVIPLGGSVVSDPFVDDA